jgi:hypothetical protein
MKDILNQQTRLCTKGAMFVLFVGILPTFVITQAWFFLLYLLILFSLVHSVDDALVASRSFESAIESSAAVVERWLMVSDEIASGTLMFIEGDDDDEETK